MMRKMAEYVFPMFARNRKTLQEFAAAKELYQGGKKAEALSKFETIAKEDPSCKAAFVQKDKISRELKGDEKQQNSDKSSESNNHKL